MRVVLACDFGGSRLKVSLVQRGHLLVRGELPAEAQRGFSRALERVNELVAGWEREGRLARGDLVGCGIAFPGIIEPATGRILSTPAGKFDDAAGFDLRGWIDSQWALPVTVCNDANAALAGEARQGAARGIPSVVMVTLGTGFGSAVMIEGVPLRGAHGQAGCLGGHLLAKVRGRECLCGNIGCVETEASTWILPTLCSEMISVDPREPPHDSLPDYRAVFHSAARGDAAARAVRDHSLQVWAAAVVSLIHAYDPERVVVGGGIMQSADAILPRLRDYVDRHAWTPWGKVEVVAASLGNDAAMIGMAALVEESLAKP